MLTLSAEYLCELADSERGVKLGMIRRRFERLYSDAWTKHSSGRTTLLVYLCRPQHIVWASTAETAEKEWEACGREGDCECKTLAGAQV